MIITKLKHTSSYTEITFDDGRIVKLCPDVCFSFSLYEGAELSDNDLVSISNEDEKGKCLNSALNFLSRRIHSEYELKQKLSRKYKDQYIFYTIQECRRLNLLNDREFAEKYIKELQAKGEGRLKLIYSLKSKGISQDIIDKCLDDSVNMEDESERALNVAEKKMRFYNKGLPAIKVKEKLFRHLQSKGFSYDTIKNVIDRLFDRNQGLL